MAIKEIQLGPFVDGLNTRDVEKATSFYGSVFGWQTSSIGGGVMRIRVCAERVLVLEAERPSAASHFTDYRCSP